MKTILIGIDDTDNLTSPGTGRLARYLCAELGRRGVKSSGVTRHQFLVDKAIPFTSHNSGACIAVESKNGIKDVDFTFDFVAKASAKGSDPGVCISFSEDISEDIFSFGKTAQEKVLQIEMAFDLVRSSSIKLYGLGGNCQGVIGALASVGLRAQGNDGRFIDMPGLRELPRLVDSQIFAKMGIEIQYKSNGRQPDPNDVYDTLDWVRPALISGKAVLMVEWNKEKNAWIPVDRQKSRPLE